MARFGSRRTVAAVLVAVGVGVWLAARPRAQNQPPPNPLATLLADGQTAVQQGRWDDAAAKFQALADLAARDHDELWAARGTLGLARIAYYKAQYAQAQSALTEILPVFERANAYFELGLTEETLGNLAEVKHDLPSAAANYDRAQSAYARAGNRRAALGAEYNSARVGGGSDQYARLAALRQEAIGIGDRNTEAAILHLWGDQLFVQGNFDGALEKTDEAVRILETLPPGSELATAYTSMGRLLRLHGQTKAALTYQLKSLAIVEKDAPSPVLVQSLNAVAVTYQSLGDVRAKAYFERAITVADQVSSPYVRSFVRANYGNALEEFGDAEHARPLLAASLPSAMPGQKTLRYAELADVDLRLGRKDEAAAEIDEGLKSCDQALSLNNCIEARITRAQIDLARGADDEAVKDQELALQSLEDLRSKLAAQDFMKQGFEDLWFPCYSVGIEMHFRRGEVAAALELAERAKSRALLDLLASRNLHATTAVPALTTRGATGSIVSDVSVASASVADLAATAARLHSSLLLYWVASDKIYAWVVGPDGALSGAVTAVSRQKLESLILQTSALADDTASRGPSARTRGDQSISLVMRPQTAWHELYSLLITPVAGYLPKTTGARITIVPHGPLINVPFAALRDADGRYLLERYAIHSLTAGAMLEYTRGGSMANPRSGRALLVADPERLPRIPGTPPLPPLPGADAEVQAIAKLLPSGRTTLLAQASATKLRVLANLQHETVLHFATHAIIEDNDPLSSFLALGGSTETGNDGELQAKDIYNLKLDANLVVLSACRSGEGVPSGDGIAALARAFFYAGTSSIIVSLWDIADEPTNRLLPAFYQQWLKGADKARALRAAQLQLIADLRAGRVKVTTPLGEVVVPEDPAFWAGFILIGEPD